MIRAFRVGEASMLAPVEYTALIWSVLLGIAIFDQYPGASILVGAAIVIAAGVYLTRHEGRSR
jgi:drug/metabolite transporter (DMT)-like permease